MNNWYVKKKKMRDLLDNPPESLNFSSVNESTAMEVVEAQNEE